MKKLIAFALCAVMVVAALAGCSNAAKPEETTATPAADATQEAAKPEAMTGAIDVLSREDGSGTRGAFIELFGVEQKNDAARRSTTRPTPPRSPTPPSVMLTTVAGDPARDRLHLPGRAER